MEPGKRERDSEVKVCLSDGRLPVVSLVELCEPLKCIRPQFINSVHCLSWTLEQPNKSILAIFITERINKK